jgi:hypothetical protein
MEGIILGDKGYISSTVLKKLIKQNFLLVTKRRKNMKQVPITKDIQTSFKQKMSCRNIFWSTKRSFSIG